MRFLVLCLLSFVLPVLAAPTGLSPSGGETVALLTDVQRTYLYEMGWSDRSKIMSKKATLSGFSGTTFDGGSPVTLAWTGGKGTCSVEVRKIAGDDLRTVAASATALGGAVAEAATVRGGTVAEAATVREGTVVWTGTTSGTSVSVVNLELDADYEWTVTDSSGTSAPAKFHTAGEPPRLIKSGEMRVMRDLGGWTGLEGRKVRQNRLFRGGPAESDYKQKPNKSLVDDAARDFFYNLVGLRTEVDMRYSTGSNAQTGSYPKFDMTGTVVNYLNLYVYWSGLYYADDTSAEGRNWGEILKAVIDPEARPLYFHCSAGRDRTGLIAGLTLALLGVGEDDIMRDYQATCYLDGQNGTDGFRKNLFTTIAGFSDRSRSLAENTAAYFMSFGITAEQIEAFRKDMLIGYGEPEWRIVEPVYVTATRTRIVSGRCVEAQYRGFLTKRGLEYAWGKDGEPATEWVESDGTPMELEKPEEDEKWELLVR